MCFQSVAVRCMLLDSVAVCCSVWQQVDVHDCLQLVCVCSCHVLTWQPYTAAHTACFHTVAHHKTLQHTATHCNAPQHTASHCNTLQCRRSKSSVSYSRTPQHAATHCNTPQHTATHRNTGAQRAGVQTVARVAVAFQGAAGPFVSRRCAGCTRPRRCVGCENTYMIPCSRVHANFWHPTHTCSTFWHPTNTSAPAGAVQQS